MADWKLLSLELDDGGRDIGKYLSTDCGYDIKRVSLEEFLAEEEKTASLRAALPDPYSESSSWRQPQVRGKRQIASMMESLTADAEGPVLAVYGSGFFHHYTYGLCAAAGRLSKEFCYIHIDGHTDCFPGRGMKLKETVIYSDFVEDIVRDGATHAKDVIMVGPSLSGFDWCRCLPYAPHRIFEEKLNSEEALDDLSRLLEGTCNDVYISFDLDVTVDDEIITDWREWERGRLRKEQLLRMASLINSRKNIIGADILGFTCDTYEFKSREAFEEMRQKSRELYRDIIGVLLS